MRGSSSSAVTTGRPTTPGRAQQVGRGEQTRATPGRTSEEVRDPHVALDLLRVRVRENLAVPQAQAKDVRKEDDGLGRRAPLGGGREVRSVDERSPGFTGENVALRALRAGHRARVQEREEKAGWAGMHIAL